MSKTRPTTDQLRFNSSANGESILDDYMEACEKGGRSLPDLLDELFDSVDGNLKNFVDLREDPLNPGFFQIRLGTYVDPNAGWETFTYTDLNQLLIDAQAARDAAQTAQTAAELAETNAAASESAAATSASDAATSETNAATSESNAASSETNASTSELNASNSAAAALASQNKAQQWATEAEDVEVETGLYSAFHWAQKAQDAVAFAVLDTPVQGDIVNAISANWADMVANRAMTIAGDKTFTGNTVFGNSVQVSGDNKALQFLDSGDVRKAQLHSLASSTQLTFGDIASQGGDGTALVISATDATVETNGTNVLGAPGAASIMTRERGDNRYWMSTSDNTDRHLNGTHDLDTIVEPGIYSWYSDSRPINSPIDMGVMIVETDLQQPHQLVFDGNSARMYIRRRNSGVYGAWSIIGTIDLTPVDGNTNVGISSDWAYGLLNGESSFNSLKFRGIELEGTSPANDSALVLHVDPATGTEFPADPMAGDAFDSYGSCIRWMNKAFPENKPMGRAIIEIEVGATGSHTFVETERLVYYGGASNVRILVYTSGVQGGTVTLQAPGGYVHGTEGTQSRFQLGPASSGGAGCFFHVENTGPAASSSGSSTGSNTGLTVYGYLSAYNGGIKGTAAPGTTGFGIYVIGGGEVVYSDDYIHGVTGDGVAVQFSASGFNTDYFGSGGPVIGESTGGLSTQAAIQFSGPIVLDWTWGQKFDTPGLRKGVQVSGDGAALLGTATYLNGANLLAESHRYWGLTGTFSNRNFFIKNDLTVGDDIHMTSASPHIRVTSYGGIIREGYGGFAAGQDGLFPIDSAGASADGTRDLGASNVRWRDGHFSRHLYANRIDISSNTYTADSDVALTANAVIASDDTLHFVAGTGNHRWWTGATNRLTGTAGATERMALSASGDLNIDGVLTTNQSSWNGSWSGAYWWRGTVGGLVISSTGPSVRPCNTTGSGASNGLMNLGDTSYRFKNGYFSGTIYNAKGTVPGGNVPRFTVSTSAPSSGRATNDIWFDI